MSTSSKSKTSDQDMSRWQAFVHRCQTCKACPLAVSRKHVVVWRGGINAPLMILGEGPGAEEDRLGKPLSAVQVSSWIFCFRYSNSLKMITISPIL